MEATLLPKFYSDFIKQNELLTREEEMELSNEVLNGTEKKRESAINKLVVSNMRLAIRIATKDFPWFVDKEDIISEAIIGLTKAASKFDSKFGARFSTYSAYYIRQHIFEYIRQNTTLVPMSARMNNFFNKIKKTTNESDSFEEMSEKTNMSAKRVESILNYKFSYVQLDAKSDLFENKTMAEVIKDENAIEPDKQFEKKNEFENLIDKFDILNEREKFIIKKRYGFDGEEPMILEDIGNVLNITRERVRQLEGNILKKIKKSIDKDKGI